MSHTKQYLGMYPAEVVSVEDPEKRCRVKLNVFDLFDGVPTNDLPWANQILSLGSRPGEGAVNPMRVGDKVWVQFVGGDTRRPVVVGSSHDSPGGNPNLAPDASGREGYSHKRTGNQPPAEEPNYYEDVVYKQNDALIQLCKGGTVRITQMGSGSAVEIAKNGDVIIHCEGNLYVSVKGNYLQEIEGNFQQVIKGSASSTSSGSYSIKGARIDLN
ncbi:MAG: hypothetical protein IJU76_14320 [Desulfovibrionaceae bacterium]|nr:hypothetical protein [Desulfovibrionaceae bacterium]